MSRWVEIIVIVLIALGALAVSAVAALYFIGPTRIKIAGGEAREYFLTFNAPPGTMTTEASAAYKGAAAALKAAVAEWPSYNKTPNQGLQRG